MKNFTDKEIKDRLDSEILHLLSLEGDSRLMCACVYRAFEIGGDFASGSLSQDTLQAWPFDASLLHDNFPIFHLLHKYSVGYLPRSFLKGSEVFSAEFAQILSDIKTGFGQGPRLPFRFMDDDETPTDYPTYVTSECSDDYRQKCLREKREHALARAKRMQAAKEARQRERILKEAAEALFEEPDDDEVISMLDSFDAGYVLRHDGKEMLPIFSQLDSEERFVQVIEANGDIRVVLVEDMRCIYPVTSFYQTNSDGYTRKFFEDYLHVQLSLGQNRKLVDEEIPSIMMESETTIALPSLNQGNLTQESTVFEVYGTSSDVYVDRLGSQKDLTDDGHKYFKVNIHSSVKQDGYTYEASPGHVPGYIVGEGRQILRRKKGRFSPPPSDPLPDATLPDFIIALQTSQLMTKSQAKEYLSGLVDILFVDETKPSDCDMQSAMYFGKMIEREFSSVGLKQVGKNLLKYSIHAGHDHETTQLLADLWNNRNYAAHHGPLNSWVPISYATIAVSDVLTLSCMPFLSRIQRALDDTKTLRELYSDFSDQFAAPFLPWGQFKDEVESLVHSGHLVKSGKYYFTSVE